MALPHAADLCSTMSFRLYAFDILVCCFAVLSLTSLYILVYCSLLAPAQQPSCSTLPLHLATRTWPLSPFHSNFAPCHCTLPLRPAIAPCYLHPATCARPFHLA